MLNWKIFLDWVDLNVGKSQKHFFLKLHASKDRTLSNILIVFLAMAFQERMLLRFADLYQTEHVNISF